MFVAQRSVTRGSHEQVANAIRLIQFFRFFADVLTLECDRRGLKPVNGGTSENFGFVYFLLSIR